MNKKIATAWAVTAIVAGATAISLSIGNKSGKVSEKKVSELLHTTVENGFVGPNDDVSEQVDSYSKNLNTNSVYDSVDLSKKDIVNFAEGSTVIVTEGEVLAVCKDSELIDITEGITLEDSQSAKLNHLYVIEDEDCALKTEKNAKVLIKGGFEITNGNKE